MSRLPSLVLVGLVCLLGCGDSTKRGEVTVTPEPPPKKTDAHVRITADAIAFGDEPVVALSGDRALGVGAEHKRSGPNDLHIVPLHDALKRAQDDGRLARQASTTKAELRVIADPTTTYRVLFEVLYTAGQTEIGRYELYEGDLGGRKLDTEPPPGFKPPPLDSLGRLVGPPTLNLTVLIVADGTVMKGSGGNIAPGCDGIGRGITLPKLAAGHDLVGLTQCAKKLKAANPSFAGETAVVLSASPGTPFREVLDAAFALRGSDTEPLFPTVHFGVAR